MASISTIARLSFDDVSPALLDATDSDSSRHSTRVFPLAAALLLSLHCAAALAGDIARDTPGASMTLAEGLYATPGPSASVSSVATPAITASPLPSASPSDKPAAAASPVTAAPSPPPPAKAPEAGWINYVAIITGIVGAIAGIAGAIMGALGLRRVNRQERRY